MPKTIEFSDEALSSIQRLAYALDGVNSDDYAKVIEKALGLLELAVEARNQGKKVALLHPSGRKYDEVKI